MPPIRKVPRRVPRGASAAVALLVVVGSVVPRFALAQSLPGQATTAPPTGASPRADSLLAVAQAGAAAAQYAYGALLVQGAEGLPRDNTGAIEWFRRAADQDHVDAMLALSTMLMMSAPAEAIERVTRAAELGSGEAQWRLAQVLSGRLPLPGVGTDVEAAADWLERAVAGGHPRAAQSLADLLTETDDPERYAEAVDLYRMAAEPPALAPDAPPPAPGVALPEPSAWAALRLGMIYAAGEGVPADDDQAVVWLSRLGSDFLLEPATFSNEDLEVLGGLQLYYGLDFTGGPLERDPGAAAEAFRIALEFPQILLHPSFARISEEMLRRLGN